MSSLIYSNQLFKHFERTIIVKIKEFVSIRMYKNFHIQFFLIKYYVINFHFKFIKKMKEEINFLSLKFMSLCSYRKS